MALWQGAPSLKIPVAAMNPHEREKGFFQDSDVAAAIHHLILGEEIEAASTFEVTKTASDHDRRDVLDHDDRLLLPVPIYG